MRRIRYTASGTSQLGIPRQPTPQFAISFALCAHASNLRPVSARRALGLARRGRRRPGRRRPRSPRDAPRRLGPETTVAGLPMHDKAERGIGNRAGANVLAQLIVIIAYLFQHLACQPDFGQTARNMRRRDKVCATYSKGVVPLLHRRGPSNDYFKHDMVLTIIGCPFTVRAYATKRLREMIPYLRHAESQWNYPKRPMRRTASRS